MRIAAIQVLVRRFGDHSDTRAFLKDRAARDKHTDVRIAAIQALANYFLKDPDICTILKNLAASDKNSDARVAAIDALGLWGHWEWKPRDSVDMGSHLTD